MRGLLAIQIMFASLIVSAGAAFAHHQYEDYPADVDSFHSTAEAIIEIYTMLPPTLVEASGPTKVSRDNPTDPGDGHMEIETEIISMSLVGSSPLGPITIRAGVGEGLPTPTTGRVRQQVAGSDFPGDSWFDLYFEIDTALGPLFNKVAMHMEAVINSIPPLGETYVSPQIVLLYNLNDPEGPPVGEIQANHTPQPGGSTSVEESTWGDVKRVFR